MKVRRYTYDAATRQLGDPMDILVGLPHGTDHGGGRLVFGPDAKLYLSRGDHGSNFLANYCDVNRAQDTPTEAEIRRHDWGTYQGKILRINLDGTIPDDNPLLNGVRSHVYSYGHRNPQGLQFGPTGLLYSSEHGPSTDDELNLIVAGGNYGWPYVAGYRDDRGYVFADWSHASSRSSFPVRRSDACTATSGQAIGCVYCPTWSGGGGGGAGPVGMTSMAAISGSSAAP